MLFESTDIDQTEFLIEANKKIDECQNLEFIPRILVQSKVDQGGAASDSLTKVGKEL